MDERAAFWELLAAMTRGGALCLCVLCFFCFLGWWLVFCGGDWWERLGMFFKYDGMVVGVAACWLFLLHPEILCLCCAFLKALHYLRVRLVNTTHTVSCVFYFRHKKHTPTITICSRTPPRLQN